MHLDEKIDFEETKRRLDKINAAILEYDPVLREKARDILLLRTFGVVVPADSRPPGANGANSPSSLLNALSSKWSPVTQTERALLVAYYLQQVLGLESVSGRQIQNTLRNYGFRLTNVSVATRENMKFNPPRMMKMKIAGKPYNHYVVTAEGIRYVEKKLTGTDGV